MFFLAPPLNWARQMHVQCFDSNLRESSHFSLLATAMGPELNEIEGEAEQIQIQMRPEF